MIKAGDKVRCITSGRIYRGRDNAPLTEGGIYKVVGTTDTNLWVCDDNGNISGYSRSRFEIDRQSERDEKELAALLADEEKDDKEIDGNPGFSVGEEVVCVHSECQEFIQTYKTYKVRAITKGGWVYLEGKPHSFMPGRFRRAPKAVVRFQDLALGAWFRFRVQQGQYVFQKISWDTFYSVYDAMTCRHAKQNPIVIPVRVLVQEIP